MFSIIVLASGERVESTGKAVDGGVEVNIVVVGKHNVEVAIELGGCEFMEALGNESQAYEIALGALGCKNTLVRSELASSLTYPRGKRKGHASHGGVTRLGTRWRTCEMMSCWVSAGKSRKLKGRLRGHAGGAASSPEASAAMIASRGDGAQAFRRDEAGRGGRTSEGC